VSYVGEHGFVPLANFVPASEELSYIFDRASEAGIENLTRVHNANLYTELCELSPDVVLAIGWPFELEGEILHARWLLLNSQPTLVPQYRGPSPWAYVIANGERETGVTVHQIDGGLDSGPVLHQQRVELTPFDTYLSLRAKVLDLEPKAILAALRKVGAGSPQFTPQDESQAAEYVRPRTPDDSEIDPTRPLMDVYDEIRACDPDRFPAFFYIEGQKVCIRLWRPEKPEGDHPDSL